MFLSLVSCGNNSSIHSSKDEPSTIIATLSDDNPTTITEDEDEISKMTIELRIDNKTVDVNWLNNDSVKALKELSKNGLTINMSMYGGFEQVGSLDTLIKSMMKK